MVSLKIWSGKAWHEKLFHLCSNVVTRHVLKLLWVRMYSVMLHIYLCFGHAWPPLSWNNIYLSSFVILLRFFSETDFTVPVWKILRYGRVGDLFRFYFQKIRLRFCNVIFLPLYRWVEINLFYFWITECNILIQVNRILLLKTKVYFNQTIREQTCGQEDQNIQLDGMTVSWKWPNSQLEVNDNSPTSNLILNAQHMPAIDYRWRLLQYILSSERGEVAILNLTK